MVKITDSTVIDRPMEEVWSFVSDPGKKKPFMRKKVGIGLAVVDTATAAIGAYLRFIRPWQLRWGATDEEVARAMSGDDVVKHPTFNATRAVTIQARPEEIWPWLVQIGCTRAGLYSYDWLDNLGIPSADRIVPELQHVAVGDLIPLSPDGKQGQRVKDFEANQWMLWWDKKGDATWSWGLYPFDESQTRLITRVRIQYRWLSPVILFDLLVEFTDIVMMRKCLLGIKQRAERASRQIPEPVEIGTLHQVRQEVALGAVVELNHRAFICPGQGRATSLSNHGWQTATMR